jgi:hypothetical protein
MTAANEQRTQIANSISSKPRRKSRGLSDGGIARLASQIKSLSRAAALKAINGIGVTATDEHIQSVLLRAEYHAQRSRNKLLQETSEKVGRAIYSVHELACGGYLVARWDRTLHCSDLAVVRQFYSRIGGAA